MTKKEFYEQMERERKGAIRTMAIGIVACIVVAVILLLLANSDEKKETKYVEQVMIA